NARSRLPLRDREPIGLAAHAGTAVEPDANGEREFACGEGGDRLRQAVLEHAKVVGSQAGQRLTVTVRDTGIDLDQIDAGRKLAINARPGPGCGQNQWYNQHSFTAQSLEPHMFGSLGLPELLIILFIVVLIFGANRLPSLARGIGSSVKSFKEGMKDGESQ